MFFDLLRGCVLWLSARVLGTNEKNVLCAFIVIAAQRFHRCATRAGSVNRWGRVVALDVVFVIGEFGMLDLGFFGF